MKRAAWMLLLLAGCAERLDGTCTEADSLWITDVRVEPALLVAGGAEVLTIAFDAEADALEGRGRDDFSITLADARGYGCGSTSWDCTFAEALVGEDPSLQVIQTAPGFWTVTMQFASPVPSDLSPGEYLVFVSNDYPFAACNRSYVLPVTVEAP